MPRAQSTASSASALYCQAALTISPDRLIMRIAILCLAFVAVAILVPARIIAVTQQSYDQSHSRARQYTECSFSSTPRRGCDAAPRQPGRPEQVDAPWPREADRGEERILMYGPQLETWDSDQISAYAALASVNKKARDRDTALYGSTRGLRLIKSIAR